MPASPPPPGPLVCRPPTPAEAAARARDFPEFVKAVEWDDEPEAEDAARA